MKRGVDQIQSALFDIDAVLEVHDARIPFSGRNNQLKDIIHIRPHILLLNKIDLADLSRKENICEKLREQGVTNVQFTNSTNDSILRYMKNDIVPLLLKEVESKPRFRTAAFNEYNILVIGEPNVGKSTILNKLRQTYTKKRKAAHVGATPGVTRSVMNKVRVNFDPDIYVIDTPGILSPKIGSDESGMRLALCDCLPSKLIGPDVIVDYMLYWLNKHKKFYYVKYYGLNQPTDNYLELLSHVGLQRQLVVPVKEAGQIEKKFRIDFTKAAEQILKEFQSGKLGKIMLDDDYLNA